MELIAMRPPRRSSPATGLAEGTPKEKPSGSAYGPSSLPCRSPRPVLGSFSSFLL